MSSKLSNETWARLISLNPNKEDINFSTQSSQLDESQANSEWKIYQKSPRDTWISNLSASDIRVDQDLLKMGQEKRLSGGEKIVFCKEKKDLDLSFDFVFCLANFQENELKRPRDESQEVINQAEKFVKKEDLDEDLKCPICLASFYRCVTLDPCQHSFCSDCLFSYFKGSNSYLCPECRIPQRSVRRNWTLQKLLPKIAFQKSDEKREKELTHLSGDILINDKGVYVGSLSDDKKRRVGHGRFGDKITGETFDGAWKDDKKEGEGVLTLKDGKIFKGKWTNDVMESIVEILYPNGDTYQGGTQHFKKYGKGVYKWSGGDYYDGDWKEDLQDGFGKSFHTKGLNGKEYEGNWAKGRRKGFGICKYNGKIYKGEWKENKIHGRGVCTYSNGDVYDGSWIEELYSGKGKYLWGNDEEYEGNWDAGQRDGNGTMKY